MKKSKHQQKVKQKVKEKKKQQESRDNQDLDMKAYCHS